MDLREPNLRHLAHKTDSRVPLIAHFDQNDLIVLGLTFVFANQVAKRVIPSPGLQLTCTAAVLLVAYFINMAVKRRLSPYPKILTHAINWYSTADVYEVAPDPDPEPLYRPRREGTPRERP